MSVSPQDAPDLPEEIEIEFKRGNPTAINGKKYSPAALVEYLNGIGGKHAIGQDRSC